MVEAISVNVGDGHPKGQRECDGDSGGGHGLGSGIRGHGISKV